MNNTAAYAFVGWIASFLVYTLYIVWAFGPELREWMGMAYYPSKYYAIALPSYAIVVYLLSGVVYIALNMILTNHPTSKLTISDENSKEAAHVFVNCDIGDIHPLYVSRSYLHDDDMD